MAAAGRQDDAGEPPARNNGSGPASLKVSEGPARVTIRAGNRTLLEYRTTASPAKPYVRELFTPGGVQILRDLVPDHKHHHGLMFALAADGVNFWGEAAGAGPRSPATISTRRRARSSMLPARDSSRPSIGPTRTARNSSSNGAKSES